MALAGIYSSWTDPDGKEQGTYAILTSRDNSHTRRSPVAILPEDEADWLNPAVGDEDSISEMMQVFASDAVKAHRVTTDLKNVKLNTPKLIEPVI